MYLNIVLSVKSKQFYLYTVKLHQCDKMSENIRYPDMAQDENEFDTAGID